MKKSKLLALIAILVLAATLMISCSSTTTIGTLSVPSMIDPKATYTPPNNIYTKMELISFLTGAEYEDYEENLIYFTTQFTENSKTYTRHII